MDEQRFEDLRNERRIDHVNKWFDDMRDLLISAQRDLERQKEYFNERLLTQTSHHEPTDAVGWAIDRMLSIASNLRITTIMQHGSAIRAVTRDSE
ncbi:MAG: hypothetical protein U1E42_05200 [Rhodospirillales bacterium]